MDASGEAPGATTILIVDDDEALRQSVRRALELHDYNVLEAGNAHEARQVLKDPGEPPDLVIMDLVLPGLEGREAANVLLAHHPDMRIVYTSGYTSQESMAMGKLEGDAAFLRKPFDVPELLRVVEEALEA